MLLRFENMLLRCFLMFAAVAAASAETVGVTELAPHVLVFATQTGNVVASVGPDGALLIGTPSVSSTPQIESILAEHTKSPVRYIVIAPEPTAESEGDAGWGKRGAFVVMHEKALERLGGHAMGPSKPLPLRLIQLSVDRPRVAFSEVITFDINGDAIHIVHQPPGFSDADSIVHYHRDSVIYLGEVFPGDGYPLLDPELGCKLDGFLKTLGSWTGPRMRVVPARGSAVTGADVKAFHDMIATVRDRVQRLIDARETEQQIVAQHPAADFDAKWGHGRVSPDAFVREVYTALTAQR